MTSQTLLIHHFIVFTDDVDVFLCDKSNETLFNYTNEEIENLKPRTCLLSFLKPAMSFG